MGDKIHDINLEALDGKTVSEVRKLSVFSLVKPVHSSCNKRSLILARWVNVAVRPFNNAKISNYRSKLFAISVAIRNEFPFVTLLGCVVAR